MIACGGCANWMIAPTVIDEDGRELCTECATYVCALCGKLCPPTDRLPWLTETGRKFVMAACALRLQNALGYERAATLIARRGPAFKEPS